ncbi:4Fe-4S dicluster domain-containing protein [Kribbella sindirgiensis]|uniref:4Fe-4S ferredoxin n=1 Tax=Kribbella sindirgiensis TaxID=1124744 RepID=A0A4R0I4X4_9ACTN|nr:4Fe-4S dicluster domain-containing protein [Kribbella sindirgiensis]TCC21574.1 4Fe-4S ferredoxin [Kribbella sindirgiensis]
MSTATIDVDGLGRLIDVLAADGYQVIGPTVRDGAIVLAELDSVDQLPSGWGVEVGPGEYRLRKRADTAMFAHSAGPQSWKQFLHPAHRKLWSTDAEGNGFVPAVEEVPKYAFLGVRGCDLAAIGVLGGVLAGGRHPDGSYVRRRPLFVVGVNCTEPGGVCFCASMGTGPAVGPGYDLVLTELVDDDGHRFVVDVGSAQGRRIFDRVPSREAPADEVGLAQEAVASAAGRMGREMPATDLAEVVRDSRESPLWDDIAARCLNCANCTLVCPTCFCTTTEDVTDLTGEHAERWQRWSSCFELDFSYLHGGEVRTSGASRYRQWLSHKLGTWYDQFGGSGCVGCGRCIAWCPVGIDLTAEAARLSAAAKGSVDVDR